MVIKIEYNEGFKRTEFLINGKLNFITDKAVEDNLFAASFMRTLIKLVKEHER